MAKAYKCDCCGKFYEGDRTQQIVFGITPSCLTDNVNKYDICSDCAESFYLWKESRNPDHKSVFEDKEDVNVFDGDVNLFDGDVK